MRDQIHSSRAASEAARGCGDDRVEKDQRFGVGYGMGRSLRLSVWGVFAPWAVGWRVGDVYDQSTAYPPQA